MSEQELKKGKEPRACRRDCCWQRTEVEVKSKQIKVKVRACLECLRRMQVDKAPATEFTCICGEMAGEVFHRRQPQGMMFQMG